MRPRLAADRLLCVVLTFWYLTLSRPSFWRSARLSFGILRADRRCAKSSSTEVQCLDLIVVEPKLPVHNLESGSTRILRIVDEISSQGYRVGVVGLRGPELAIVEPKASADDPFGGPVSGDDAWRAMRTARAIWLARPDAAGRVISALGLDHDIRIYDTVDLHWRRYAAEAAKSGSARLWTLALVSRWLERLVASISDHTIVVSNEERRLLVGGAARRVDPAVISNIHDLGEPASIDDRSGLVFVGAFGHRPNVDAVEWIVDEIAPLLDAEGARPTLLIAGTGLPDQLVQRLPPNVQYLGWVEDLDALLASSRGLLAPLRYGAGVKGKVGSALAAGLPVVTTPVGAQGLCLVHEQSVLLGETAPDLADGVRRLIEDDQLWEKLSSRGQDALARSTQDPAQRKRYFRSLLGTALSLGTSDADPSVRNHERSVLQVPRAEATIDESPDEDHPGATGPVLGVSD